MASSSMRRGVAFDTTPMIWGVREYADPGQEHMIEHTKRYIERLESQKYAIIIPSPVIAEFFVGATDTEMREMNLLLRGYEYPYLDARSAYLAAQLQRGGIVDQIHDEFGTPKQHIKTDALIIAVALVAEAEMIVTNNVREFRKLARGKITVEQVPVIPVQTDMTGMFEES